jgi:hypothetical protein
MSIEQGLSRVAPIVDSFSVAGVLDPSVYGAFDVNVMEYADQRGQSFAAPTPCRAQYNSHKPELQMWFFGIMLCEYVAGLLAKKVEEGHCNEHRNEPELKPCPKTRPTHLDMLKAFRADLSALVSEIDEKVSNLSSLPQS